TLLATRAKPVAMGRCRCGPLSCWRSHWRWVQRDAFSVKADQRGHRMNRVLPVFLGLAVSLVVGAAARSEDSDPGIYGQIDSGKFARPPVIRRNPVIADNAKRRTAAKPIYLHVPPGQEWHWYAHCHTYNACSVPVYFVTESWFVNVYLPAIGSRDGREQRYRILAARERASERDLHDRHDGD